jgi:hypothetical protein
VHYKTTRIYTTSLCDGTRVKFEFTLSKFLQTQNIDLIEAIQTANYVVNIIKQLRLNDKSEFKFIFNNVKSKCDVP